MLTILVLCCCCVLLLLKLVRQQRRVLSAVMVEVVYYSREMLTDLINTWETDKSFLTLEYVCVTCCERCGDCATPMPQRTQGRDNVAMPLS